MDQTGGPPAYAPMEGAPCQELASHPGSTNKLSPQGAEQKGSIEK